MKVTIRQEAADDLESIVDWIAKEDRAAAVELGRLIRERIGRLETPGLAHMGRPGAIIDTRELVEAPYIIVYSVDEPRAEIEILAIFHARQERR
jgi:toxin ParE1/3/4